MCPHTKINANSGIGANVCPTIVDTVPNMTVINAAKTNAVNGDDITIGNWSAMNTLHITMIPIDISRKFDIGCGRETKTDGESARPLGDGIFLI